MVFLHTLQPNHPLKRKKRIGRGGKRGTFSGRGTKGQHARAGAKIRPQEREDILKIPKKRGTGFMSRRKLFAKRVIPINLDTLDKHFHDGELVNIKTLTKKGLLYATTAKTVYVKILGRGKLTKKLTCVGVFVSQQAKAAVESCGGSVK